MRLFEMHCIAFDIKQNNSCSLTLTNVIASFSEGDM